VISAAIIGSGVILARREAREAESSSANNTTRKRTGERFDPNAHLGRTGTE
jgi:hypothetical protein